MLIVRIDHLFFPDSGVVSAVAVYADAVSLRWQRGLHDCASRPRRQNFFGAASCPDPRGRGKDVEGGVHAGHGDDAVFRNLMYAYVKAFLEDKSISRE